MSVRLAGAADSSSIVRILSDYIPEVDAARRFEWLYEKNPHGRARTWVAVDEQTRCIVGMTSFFPRKMVVEGSCVLGALGGDGYVLPAYRRRGLGAALLATARREMARFGIELMFGTPMPANRTPLRCIGGRDVTEVVLYSRPLGGLHLRAAPSVTQRVAAWLLDAAPTRCRLVPARAPDPRIDDLWAVVSRELRVGTVRDAAFYAWRFSHGPTGRQRPFVVLDGERAIAACALEDLDDHTRLVDLVAPRAHRDRALTAIFAHLGAKAFVDFKVTRQCWRHDRLLSRGFLPNGSVKPLNLVLPEGSRLAGPLSNPDAWYFTWADTDRDFS